LGREEKNEKKTKPNLLGVTGGWGGGKREIKQSSSSQENENNPRETNLQKETEKLDH